MDATASSSRLERGLQLVKGKAKAFKTVAGDSYFVPSATNAGSGYIVDAIAGRCSCPDFEARGEPCKHVYAVRYFRHELEMPDGSTVVTEAIRVSYPQRWAQYNRAQVEEKSRLQILLGDLCANIAQPPQPMGKPRLPLRDVVYGSCMKVYTTVSGRRASSDLRSCEAAGYMDHAPAYNSVSKYLGKPELRPLLSKLVDESARPFSAIERRFAIDATGFTSPAYVRWYDFKHGEDRRAKQWVKLHAATGVLTNVVTAATVTPGEGEDTSDSSQFIELVERTAKNFQIDDVSADKAYLAHANLAAVERVGGTPIVPFKSNSTPFGSPAWERMYHLFALNRPAFLERYHKRSNVESTFSSIKRKFGPGVRSKTMTAQFNEVLCKVIVHNLSCLVHAIHELEIDPQFWTPPTMPAERRMLP
jgi:Transposase DDE domain/SWIM zinc finger